jgi:ABC-type Na+ efflux pump permease subunit
MNENVAKKKNLPVWAWVVAVIVIFGVIGAIGSGSKKTDETSKINQSIANSISSSRANMTQAELDAEKKAELAKAELDAKIKAEQKRVEDERKAEEARQASLPIEYKSALKKATSYANNQHMSKQSVYKQLTSEYGENFSPESAQYAIDNVKSDWNANALYKAKSYQTGQSMSPSSIYKQLISDYGEQFTEEQAQYAIDNLPK